MAWRSTPLTDQVDRSRRSTRSRRPSPASSGSKPPTAIKAGTDSTTAVPGPQAKPTRSSSPEPAAIASSPKLASAGHRSAPPNGSASSGSPVGKETRWVTPASADSATTSLAAPPPSTGTGRPRTTGCPFGPGPMGTNTDLAIGGSVAGPPSLSNRSRSTTTGSRQRSPTPRPARHPGPRRSEASPSPRRRTRCSPHRRRRHRR